MGWSCAKQADDVMDRWSDVCRKQNGSSNQYTGTDGRTYFYETSRTEHDDGAITGTTWRFTTDGVYVNKAGSFRIEGNGIVTRKPTAFPPIPCTSCGDPASGDLCKRCREAVTWMDYNFKPVPLAERFT